MSPVFHDDRIGNTALGMLAFVVGLGVFFLSGVVFSIVLGDLGVLLPLIVSGLTVGLVARRHRWIPGTAVGIVLAITVCGLAEFSAAIVGGRPNYCAAMIALMVPPVEAELTGGILNTVRRRNDRIRNLNS